MGGPASRRHHQCAQPAAIYVVAYVLAGVLLLAPARAHAQASITGMVRDSSGAVLPGVTVEAASPSLIEKVRTATTDSNGQYRIVDLRAGEYTVTFALPGFTTVKREGVTLEGSFTATINTDLRVGALTETITVTGESPIVDVQSVKRQVVLDNETISAIPSSRSYNNLIQLMPNSINQAGAPTDVQMVPGMVVFGGFGGRSNEGRVNVDGISVGLRLQRRRRVVVHHRRRQRARDSDDRVRRPRRDRRRRPGAQRAAERRRQLDRTARSSSPAPPRA